MYIWIGCKLPEDFAQALRTFCLRENAAIGLDTTAFSLPQHISLKISFDAPEYEQVLDELSAFLSAERSFSVRLLPPQRQGQILWLPAEEDPVLRQLHDRLDGFLERRFGIPQHEFDKAFLFHSTLFIDSRGEKLHRMHRVLSPFPLPRELQIDTFLLGISPDGTAGSFRVVRSVEI